MSYNKKRHILNANILLEQKFLYNKVMIKEQETEVQGVGNKDPFENVSYPTIPFLINSNDGTVTFYPKKKYAYFDIAKGDKSFREEDLESKPKKKLDPYNQAGRVKFNNKIIVQFAPEETTEVNPGDYLDFSINLDKLHGFLYRNGNQQNGEEVGIKS